MLTWNWLRKKGSSAGPRKISIQRINNTEEQVEKLIQELKSNETKEIANLEERKGGETMCVRKCAVVFFAIMGVMLSAAGLVLGDNGFGFPPSEDAGSIKGRIRAPSPDSYLVIARNIDGQSGGVGGPQPHAEDRGSFRVENVPPGTYDLTIICVSDGGFRVFEGVSSRKGEAPKGRLQDSEVEEIRSLVQQLVNPALANDMEAVQGLATNDFESLRGEGESSFDRRKWAEAVQRHLAKLARGEYQTTVKLLQVEGDGTQAIGVRQYTYTYEVPTPTGPEKRTAINDMLYRFRKDQGKWRFASAQFIREYEREPEARIKPGNVTYFFQGPLVGIKVLPKTETAEIVIDIPPSQDLTKYEEDLHKIEEERLKQYRFLARLYQMKEDFPKAAQMYEKILELKPEEERNLYPTLASLYERAQMYDKAAEAYRKLIKLYPRNYHYYLSLARVYEKMGKDKEAELEYKRIIDEAREKRAIEQAQTRLFELYRRQNRLDEVAAEYEEKLSKMEKESLKLYKSLGEAYEKEGNYRKAIEMYKRACTLLPTDINLHLALAELYKKKRMFEEAINEYEKVLKMSPAGKVKAKVKKEIEEIKGRKE